MKTKIYLIALVLSAALFSACSDFLDVQPEGSNTTTTYFTNDQQAIDAIDGLYTRTHNGDDMYGREMFWEQGGANDVVWGRTRGYPTLATLKYTGDESPLRGTFNVLYSLISRANWIVEKLTEKEGSTTLTAIERRSLGEAYFMRGMGHFYVAYRYGTNTQGVPFCRYEDKTEFPDGYDNSIPKQRATVMENYQMIIDDMEKAISYLPKFEDYADADKGRAHQAAAMAFEVKTYAYWATWDESKWNNVIDLVGKLEKTYGRDLAPNFKDVFSADFSKFWNAEYIWTIPGTGGSSGGGVEFPGVILENKGWGIYNGWGQNKPTLDIYEEMAADGEDNDRLTASILEYNQEFTFFGNTRKFYSTSDIEAGFMINKYMQAFEPANAATEGYVNTNGDWPTTRINFPIIRFAEMLLFRAEAYLMTNQGEYATNDLNRIRVRSNLDKIEGEATMADLYHERRCELAFEYTDHLFDLKRWFMSSNAEIKALATSELNARPRVRHYEERGNPESLYTIGYYEDYTDKGTYDSHLMVFPYPSEQITKSAGALTQNPGY